MLTTVIIPVHNRASMLPRAVHSLWRQRADVDLDILVIDDGSTDPTPAVIADLQRQIPILRAVRQENTGVTGARNCALAHLLPETEIVTFLDSDDVSPEGRFAADLPHLATDPDLDLTYGRMRTAVALDPETLCPVEGTTQIEFVGIQLASALMRRRLVDRIGPFDMTLRQAEDTDYLLRIFETGTKFKETQTTTVYYVMHDGNMIRNAEEAKRTFLQAIQKSLHRRRRDPSRQLNLPGFRLVPQGKPEGF